MLPITQRLIDHWAKQGIAPCAGCTDEQISSVESRSGIRFPEYLRDYFANAVGYDEGVLSDFCMHWWSLKSVSPLSEQTNRRLSEVQSNEGFIFAECLIRTCMYAIRIKPSRHGSNDVWTIGEEKRVVASTFSEFLELLLSPNGEFSVQ